MFLRALKAEGIFSAPGYLPVYEQELWHIDRRRFPFARPVRPGSGRLRPARTVRWRSKRRTTKSLRSHSRYCSARSLIWMTCSRP